MTSLSRLPSIELLCFIGVKIQEKMLGCLGVRGNVGFGGGFNGTGALLEWSRLVGHDKQCIVLGFYDDNNFNFSKISEIFT